MQDINKSLSMLKKRPNTELSASTSDDMSTLHLNYKYNNNNNINTNNNNSNANYTAANNNLVHSSNISNSKFTNNNQNLNNINNNINNNTNNNNNNNNHVATERRNSIISTSSSQHLSSKSRPRCDSYGGAGTSSEYGNNSTGKLSPSPSTISYYHSHLHYNSHNHLADKVMYLTNAVSNAAAAANSNTMSSPKYGRLKSQLSVDTSGGDVNHYPDYVAQPQQKMGQYQQGQQFSPRDYAPSCSGISGNVVVVDVDDDDDDDDDDLAGQYATLMTINSPQMDYIYQPMQPAPMTPRAITPRPITPGRITPGSYEPAGSHYSVIGERSEYPKQFRGR